MSPPRCEVCGWDGSGYAGRDGWDPLTTEHPRVGDDLCVGPELVRLRAVAERARTLLLVMDAHDLPHGMTLAREAFHELSDAVDALPTPGDQPAPTQEPTMPRIELTYTQAEVEEVLAAHAAQTTGRKVLRTTSKVVEAQVASQYEPGSSRPASYTIIVETEAGPR